MLKNILILLGALTLVACESSTSGTVVVDQSFVVNATIKCSGSFGNPNNTCVVPKTIKAGSYNGVLTAKGRNELFLSLKSGANIDLSINVPSSVRIPELNGQFNLTSAQSRQPFDLNGLVSSTQSDSETKREWESCYVTRHRQVCHAVPPGGYVCHDEVVNYPGQKQVEYFVRSTHKTINVDLFKTGTDEKIGSFSGAANSQERHYLYQGICY